ncbi:MAG: stage III sporulation protein AE [Clostridia bacterium]|nr:stage III sporulation protein AE [Clostridia bacterium]
MKKLVLFTLILIALYCVCPETAHAEESFNDVLSTLIDSLEGDELNEALDGVWESYGGEKGSLKDKLLSVINGDFSLGYGNAISAISALVFSGVKSLFPTLISVCVIAVLYSLVKTLNPEFLSEGTDRILYFTCYAAILGLLIYKAFDIANGCFSAISTYSRQMETVFPLILTVMAATGSSVSASVYTPAVAFLSNGITVIITGIVMPMSLFLIMFSSVSGLSHSMKTEKFGAFVSSAIKWILGICVTVFTVFLSVKGITAGTYDGITLRVTKYALGNSVPLVGGFLRDGAELFVASGVLIKNALGICGLALVAGVFIAPVTELIAFSMFLKLVSGITEPFIDNKITDFLFGLSKNLNFVLASALVVCFMYVITVVLLIFSGGALL